jgi:hypothetical protein
MILIRARTPWEAHILSVLSALWLYASVETWVQWSRMFGFGGGRVVKTVFAGVAQERLAAVDTEQIPVNTTDKPLVYKPQRQIFVIINC